MSVKPSDSQWPAVKLSTTSNMRTRCLILPMLIRFMKPVFGFNSSHISVSGGYLQGFHELSKSVYSVDIQADDDIVSINVPKNITKDVAGNGNLASNILQVRHSLVAGLLTISITSLQSTGAFRRRSSSLTSNPTSNLFWK